MQRIIAHLDMDAFFAAVEERDKPRLKGRPIVVGADPAGGKGRGVVSTANYAARKFGIHSAMPISEAWRRAEEGKRATGQETAFIGGNYQRYSEVSANIFSLVQAHVPIMQQVGVDEAYLDMSHTGSYETAIALARRVKEEIKEKQKLTASVGIGPNKLIAKIASDMNKPDGLTVVEPSTVLKFLDPLSIRKIPGIGPKTEVLLVKQGVRTVADLKKLTEQELIECFGKWGSGLYAKARGEDDAPVVEEHEVRSIGEQETFSEDSADANFIAERLADLSRAVHGRFIASGFKTFRTVVLTVRFADFETVSRAHTLKDDAHTHDAIQFESLRLLMPFFDRRENPKRKPMRLVGVRIEKLA